MLLRYTEKHPEVIAVRDTITELKGASRKSSIASQAGGRPTGVLSQSLKSNPVYQAIQAELNKTDVAVAEMRQDLAQRSQRVAQLKKMVDTVPEVEAELARLNRDYEITRTRYRELVERRETAKLSESAERQGSVKFQIIDPPTVGFRAGRAAAHVAAHRRADRRVGRRPRAGVWTEPGAPRVSERARAGAQDRLAGAGRGQPHLGRRVSVRWPARPRWRSPSASRRWRSCAQLSRSGATWACAWSQRMFGQA